MSYKRDHGLYLYVNRNCTGGVKWKMLFLTNLNATDCCQTATDEKLIYFPTNSCKLQKHLGSSKIRSLKTVLLGKIHALLQAVLLHVVKFAYI